MNKYQEALDNLIKVSCPKKTCCNDCVMKQICNCKAKEYIDTLQKLIDKATLKKPYHKDPDEPLCPYCHNPICEPEGHCEVCDQRIDWSDE